LPGKNLRSDLDKIRPMAILFKTDQHQYTSNDGSEIDWISVTTLISSLKPSFDAVKQAEKSARNKKSKWYGMTPEEIQLAWTNEGKRATDLGTWYHNQREADICSLKSLERFGKEVSVYLPKYDEEGNKLAPSQKLVDGCYPEHLVYLKSCGLCGQSDLVDVVDGKIHITDYKTNKEIKTEGFTNWEGITSKMNFPVSHLDDCHLMHYSLQLSIYMYMMLKHNPKLKPGTMMLHHITFEEAGQDKFGYPIAKRGENGDPIVKDIVPYEVGYLKEEVVSVINWLVDNRHKIKKKK
jgi:ATP-dependent exoDNAse (exonuclease V) beta subunit